MHNNQRLRRIKLAQKESLFFRQISTLLLKQSFDDPDLRVFSVSRVKFSLDKSICTIFFSSPDKIESFNKHLPRLIAYKVSLRKALAQAIPSRYTPELQFRFDQSLLQQQKVETLLNKIKDEKEDRE